MPERFINLFDLIVVAIVLLSGAGGGLGGGAAVAIKRKVLPTGPFLIAYATVGAVASGAVFAAQGITDFVLVDGSIDLLRLFGHSVAGGFAAATAVSGINLLGSGYLSRKDDS